MSDKELYRQKMQAHLDEWKAELEKLKARASRADAETRMKMKDDITDLEKKLEAGRAKLSELEKTSGEAWGSVRTGMDAAWKSLKAGFSDAASKFKK